MQNLRIAILSYRSAPYGGGQGVYVHDISKALAKRGHQVDIISGPPYPKVPEGIKLIQLPGLDLFQTFSLKERIKIFKRKKNKDLSNYFEFWSVLFGGFPEMKTFGTFVNADFGNVEETGILISVEKIYEEKRSRYITL